MLTASLTGFMDQEFRRRTGFQVLPITELEGEEQKELLHRTANILKMGLLSTEFRWMVNMQKEGLSPMLDFEEGSADSVYAQLLVKKNFQENMSLNELSYNGTVRFFLDSNLTPTSIMMIALEPDRTKKNTNCGLHF